MYSNVCVWVYLFYLDVMHVDTIAIDMHHSCEVIRDKKTGDSLCYAFIEFDQREECEEAYFKMDNVLIDDCRIHVDFSQSVSKLHGEWIGKRSLLGIRQTIYTQGVFIR